MTGKIVHRESSEGSTYCSQSILIYIRQRIGSIIDSGEIVTHTLTGPVAADLLTPLRAEARQTATVRSNDHISLRGHDHEVPTIAPELTDRTLRTTLAEEQGRIFLILIEVWRQDHPVEHLLAIGCLHPFLAYLSWSELIEDMLILEGELLDLYLCTNGSLLLTCLLLDRCDDIQIGRLHITVALYEDLLAVVHHLHRTEVSPEIRQQFYFSFPVDGVEVLCGVPYTDEVDQGLFVV